MNIINSSIFCICVAKLEAIISTVQEMRGQMSTVKRKFASKIAVARMSFANHEFHEIRDAENSSNNVNPSKNQAGTDGKSWFIYIF